jgi:hypothetical protein
MPCSDGAPDPRWLADERDRANGAIIGLCRACALLEKHKIPAPELLIQWYTAHKAVDAQKLVVEAEEAKLKKLIVDATAQGFDVHYRSPVREPLQAARNVGFDLQRIERAAQIALCKLDAP